MKKFAKTLVVMGIVGMSALLTTPAFAATESVVKENQVLRDPGMTPENTFYFLDKFGERIHLLVTTNKEKKSDLYLNNAEERLTESSILKDVTKDKYTKELVAAYVANLQKAQDKIADVLVDDTIESDVKNRLSTKLEKVTTLVTSDSVESSLDKKQRTSLESKKQEGYLVANMMTKIDVEKVKSMREQGLHIGEIVKIIAFAEASGKNESEIIELLNKNNQKFGKIAKELNIQQGDLWRKVNLEKLGVAQKAYERAVVSGNQSEIERVDKVIDGISKEQIALGADNSEIQHIHSTERKLAIIQQKADAGLIPQEKADWIKQKIQMTQEKQQTNSKEMGSGDSLESKVDKDKSQQNAQKEEAKKLKKEVKADEKVVEKTKKSEEKQQKIEAKAAENEKKKQDKTAEKEQNANEKAAENERKVAEQAKKDQEKTAENERKAREKAAEQAKKEQEKAAENERKAKEKAAEQAKKEREKAAENERKAKEKAAEQAKKEQEKAAENERKAKEKAAEQAKKEREKATKDKGQHSEEDED